MLDLEQLLWCQVKIASLLQKKNSTLQVGKSQTFDKGLHDVTKYLTALPLVGCAPLLRASSA